MLYLKSFFDILYFQQLQLQQQLLHQQKLRQLSQEKHQQIYSEFDGSLNNSDYQNIDAESMRQNQENALNEVQSWQQDHLDLNKPNGNTRSDNSQNQADTEC